MPNESILVVEDTPVNLKLVRFLLLREGFDVHTAESAEEALEVLKGFKPRLVLTDIQLPGMDGLELIRHLKSNAATRDMVVLALTAFAMKGDEKKAFDAGCDGYITKPIDTRSFPNLIREHLSRANEASSASVSAPSEEESAQDALIREIRLSFVTEGKQEAARLIGMVDGGLNVSEARVTAHRWAGAGGQVGCPEISQKARELEAALQLSDPASVEPARALLLRLAELFGAAMEADEVPSVPSYQ
jgi:two-component system, cell cycle response regulator DivK